MDTLVELLFGESTEPYVSSFFEIVSMPGPRSCFRVAFNIPRALECIRLRGLTSLTLPLSHTGWVLCAVRGNVVEFEYSREHDRSDRSSELSESYSRFWGK